MLLSDYEKIVHDWEYWIKQSNNMRYDIALFKIWISTELFFRDLFLLYVTGNKSEKGFLPNLTIKFIDEEHFNSILLQDGRKYIDYMMIIEKKSKHLFKDNPFDIVFNDSKNKNVINEIVSIRNYIAHESGEAKSKYVNFCFSGDQRKFLEPNIFLCEQEKQSRKSFFTYYIESLLDITKLLVDPPC